MYDDYKVSNIVDEVVRYYERKIDLLTSNYSSDGVGALVTIIFHAGLICLIHFYPSIGNTLWLLFIIKCISSAIDEHESNRTKRFYREAIKEARLAEVHYEINKALRETNNVRNIDSHR